MFFFLILFNVRFPFYYEFKIVFVLWMLSPMTQGSSFLFKKFVHPQLARREKVSVAGYQLLKFSAVKCRWSVHACSCFYARQEFFSFLCFYTVYVVGELIALFWFSFVSYTKNHLIISFLLPGYRWNDRTGNKAGILHICWSR